MTRARHLIEALFQTGAAFIDVSNSGWLTPSGVMYVPSSGDVKEICAQFVDRLSRGAKNRRDLTKDPVDVVEQLIARGLLIVAVHRGAELVIVSNKDRMKLSPYQLSWLESRFSVDTDSDIILASSLKDPGTDAPASYALYGQGYKPDVLRSGYTEKP